MIVDTSFIASAARYLTRAYRTHPFLALVINHYTHHMIRPSGVRGVDFPKARGEGCGGGGGDMGRGEGGAHWPS